MENTSSLFEDTVKVIRCKFCKYATKSVVLDNIHYYGCIVETSKDKDFLSGDNDFCSHGELRDDLKMRPATDEEREGISNYIDSISKDVEPKIYFEDLIDDE